MKFSKVIRYSFILTTKCPLSHFAKLDIPPKALQTWLGLIALTCYQFSLICSHEIKSPPPPFFAGKPRALAFHCRPSHGGGKFESCFDGVGNLNQLNTRVLILNMKKFKGKDSAVVSKWPRKKFPNRRMKPMSGKPDSSIKNYYVTAKFYNIRWSLKRSFNCSIKNSACGGLWTLGRGEGTGRIRRNRS